MKMTKKQEYDFIVKLGYKSENVTEFTKIGNKYLREKYRGVPQICFKFNLMSKQIKWKKMEQEVEEDGTRRGSGWEERRKRIEQEEEEME